MDGLSVETRASWVVAIVALFILAVAYGAPLLSAVALKPMAAELAVPRSAPALAASLSYIGAGVGGILAGWLSERIGIRVIVMFGACMIGAGLAVSALGGLMQIYAGHGLLMGLFGASCMFSPIMTYVSRWFDQRRGTALALISSGQYVAGVVWPALFQVGVGDIGWRRTMAIYALVVIGVITPLAAVFLRAPPEAPPFSIAHRGPPRGSRVVGLSPNSAMALLSAASFCCCVTMAMPMQHLVAFCTDVKISATHGAIMLSVMLGCAFISRQFWGWLADKVGGLETILWGSACQAMAMTGFLLTQDEIGLFGVSAAFGLGYAGLIPAYVLAVRALYPVNEASWRVPVVLFAGLLGMAAGGWGAGRLYDYFGFYAPAFATGILFNLLNLAVILPLVVRDRGQRRQPAMA
ncbi:MAG: MFS transporter [Acetobacteraceae bacterium]|nr:MFS transporter [Acetobacteraceae bacterium]